MAQAVTALGDLSEMLANAEAQLESLDKTVPKKEQGVLRAAHHNLRNAHCMLVGAKWMLENQNGNSDASYKAPGPVGRVMLRIRGRRSPLG